MDSYIELSSSKLLENYRIFKAHSSERQLYAVVKGNAYGFGLREVVHILDQAVDGFCVEDTQELIALRRGTRKPCLVLGHASVDALLPEHISQTAFALYTWEQIPELKFLAQKMKVTIPVHIKVDAMMGRLGFLPGELDTLITILQRNPSIDPVGVFAHLSTAKAKGLDHMQTQYELFVQMSEKLRIGLKKNLTRHIDATGGLFYRAQQEPFEMARLGAGLYGIWPHPNEQQQVPHFRLLSFALRWCSHVMQVKQVPKGWPIGYDRSYITEKPTKIAVIPQGYADGVDRQLSNTGEVLVQDTICPVLGKVSMNMFVVDVTHIGGVKTGDEVVFFGRQQNKTILPYQLAELGQTNEYEILTRISPFLPRLITR